MISEPESREAPDDAKLASLTMRLADRLNALGWTLATAESCTGGWIAKCCTDLAGSSVWFRAGIVAYSYKAKQDLLFVDALTIEQEGAVSEAVVNKMAEAVRLSAGADGVRRCQRNCRTRGRHPRQTRGHRLLCLGRTGGPAGR